MAYYITIANNYVYKGVADKNETTSKVRECEKNRFAEQKTI